MALSENGNEMVMPVTPMGGSNAYGFGDGLFWIIILFLFAWMGNGWGNNPVQTGNEVQRGFDQQALISGQANILANLNAMAMNFQNCCCDNRAQIADLKYTVATEACADRQAVNSALRDLQAEGAANTQIILDKLCQQEIDALKAQNAQLQTQINLANLRASQTDQTAKILADNAAQTQALEQYLNPAPIPAYMVQNPNCCSTPYAGCGCSA